MSAAEPVCTLSGSIECRRAAGPLGVTLIGRTEGGVLQVAFQGRAPPELPERLEGARIERLRPGSYLIASGGRSWELAAQTVYLHRDVGEAFYAAVPPRPVPRAKRVLLWLVITLAARPLGRRLLVRLRRALH